MSVKERIKSKIEQNAIRPISATALEAVVRNKDGPFRCSKKWYNENVDELVAEGRLLYVAR